MIVAECGNFTLERISKHLVVDVATCPSFRFSERDSSLRPLRNQAVLKCALVKPGDSTVRFRFLRSQLWPLIWRERADHLIQVRASEINVVPRFSFNRLTLLPPPLPRRAFREQIVLHLPVHPACHWMHRLRKTSRALRSIVLVAAVGGSFL